MKVTVTKKDIVSGKAKEASNCPIALAISKKLKDKHVAVDTKIVSIDGKNYSLPSKATKFIKRFDKGMKVRPFSFILDRRK